MKEKIYIAGPITHRPDGNKQAFWMAEWKLRDANRIILNPHVVCQCLSVGSPWLRYMQECIKVLVHVDAIYMLKGWQFSRGARAEWIISKLLGIRRVYK